MAPWTKESTEKADSSWDNPQAVDYSPPTKEELAKVKAITIELKDDIAKLKKPTEDVIGEYRITRFLRAYDGKEKKTKNEFKKFLQLRTEDDHLMERAREMVEDWTPEEMLKYYRNRRDAYTHAAPFCGVTPSGDLMCFAFSYASDTEGWLKNRPKDRPFEYDIWVWIVMLEWRYLWLDRNCRKLNRMCYCIEVRDQKGMDESIMKTMMNSKMHKFFSSMQKYIHSAWIENHSVMLMVNSNKASRVMLNMFKVFMSGRSRNKIYMLGNTEKESTRASIYKYIPQDICPKHWGGSGNNTWVEDEYAIADAWNKTESSATYAKTTTLDIFSDKPLDLSTLPELTISPQMDKRWDPKSTKA